METKGVRIQNSLYQAMKDLFLAVLYHMEHFLNQLGHTALLLWWRLQYEGQGIGQKYATQILRKARIIMLHS